MKKIILSGMSAKFAFFLYMVFLKYMRSTTVIYVKETRLIKNVGLCGSERERKVANENHAHLSSFVY